MALKTRLLSAAALLALAACGSQTDEDRSTKDQAPAGQLAPTGDALALRLDTLDAAVMKWQTATDLVTAHAAAEEVRNLVVGPAGPIYDDADRDGEVAGASDEGLLPGTRGQVALVAGEADRCLLQNVLGGSWTDPGARWAQALIAFDSWRPGNDAISSLPSPTMRLVGWATLGLESLRIDASRDFAQQAAHELQSVRRAIEGCAA
ncbi:hypothetical protein [Croceibacterium aestuarii]|uniref:hypothetical protein n=1 Tax=Croceibacterium aestuarii TaxID=3064139 RepID=UPI00272E957C|nr:hypothetical protein [Croceibacterium sp. D39]